jgi:hypothetical protein
MPQLAAVGMMTGVGASTVLAGRRLPTAIESRGRGDYGGAREEAGNRYCVVLLLNLLSRPREDVCRRTMAHVRTDSCPWAH